ncbi:hypothetical protein RN001_010301 [Aquatica leii]|uniref:Bromo domain-containing protein n=1 Tax=Aquatica leii TaxID=1421715 RepID=A0AAN7P0R1_9COLE|nr:hypothetical protein RN001_010301 [Aquatica leii]
MKPEMGKHKKNKSDRRERYESPLDSSRSALGLKLILKVGSQGTPEHSTDWTYPNANLAGDEMLPQSLMGDYYSMHRSHHKKSKKKKKKKDKNKDRERKHRHHHKDKKRKRVESGQEDDDEHSNNLQAIANVGSPSGRELRQCVLRQRQERTPLQRALEHLLKKLEMRDPQQFFAWPVTDNIAPGYSAIITHPMDFCTMRQKVDDNQYKDLQDFMSDFKLMCTNAMQYNQSDTIYYKASKKLLHAGMKLVQPDKIGWLITLTPDVTSRDLGFEITAELRQEQRTANVGDTDEHEDMEGCSSVDYAKKRLPASKFEAIPDDLLPEQILARAQNAAREVKARLNAKRSNPNLGFLRQRKDGSTFLNILVGGDGVIPGTKKRPVLLGSLTGKIADGTSQIQGFREDRRNIAKPVKPLYYGAFGSYAPSYDSAFANLTKDESDLVFQTYGSDTSVQYAESILDFAKDCDYTLQMVDSLLDLLTGGDHSKTKKVLEEKKMLREEEEAIKTVLEVKPADPSQVPIDVDDLRNLGQHGINMDFLDEMEDDIRVFEDWQQLQQRLDVNSQLLECLQRKQHSRLSAPVPQHLNNVAQPTEEEIALAESVTDNLTDMAKRVNPSDITPIPGIHKALGVTLPSDMEVGGADVPDLESELRQFLESEPSLAQSPLRDDKTIEEILME